MVAVQVTLVPLILRCGLRVNVRLFVVLATISGSLLLSVISIVNTGESGEMLQTSLFGMSTISGEVSTVILTAT